MKESIIQAIKYAIVALAFFLVGAVVANARKSQPVVEQVASRLAPGPIRKEELPPPVPQPDPVLSAVAGEVGKCTDAVGSLRAELNRKRAAEPQKPKKDASGPFAFWFGGE